MTEELNWSENSFTLFDIDSQLCINSCTVKIEQGKELQTFLDQFTIKYFKTLFSVQAYKMNNKEDFSDTSTYGEVTTIPLDYAKRGSIIPLYGASHIFKTVEEMIMAFPRFVEVQEKLTFCSNNCLINLEPGDHLELLKVETLTNSNSDQLVCHKIGSEEKLYLTASIICRFKTLPDPNTYSIREVLKILKLPQVISFESNSNVVTNLEGAEGNFNGVGYLGSYLLVGLHKSRGVVIDISDQYETSENESGYILPLDSDLFKHLKYHFAFNNDFKSLKIGKSKSNNHALDQDSLEMIKKYSENNTNSATAPVPTQDIYLLPEAQKKSSTSGDKIVKKINTALETVKTKIKKTSSKEITEACKDLAPVSFAHISKKLYPSLTKIKLTPEAKDNIYQDVESIALEGKSRFFSSVYASVNISEIDSTTESLIHENKPNELDKMEKKSRLHNKIPSGSDLQFYGTPPPIPERKQNYNDSLDNDSYENCQRMSTLKVSNRRSGIFEQMNNLQSNNEKLVEEGDVQTDHKRTVNSGMASQSSKKNELNDGVDVHSKMVAQNNGTEIDKDNTKDERKNDGVAVDIKESILFNDIANNKAMLEPMSAPVLGPKPKQSSTTVLEKNSKPASLVTTSKTSKSSPTSVTRKNSAPPTVKIPPKPLIKSNSQTHVKPNSMTLPRKASLTTSEPQKPSLPLANRPPMPIPQPISLSVTQPESRSLLTTTTTTTATTTTAAAEAAEQTNSSKALCTPKMTLANRPRLPIPQTTTPTTPQQESATSSPAAISPTSPAAVPPASKSSQHKPKESTENMHHASVKELCILLESCGLHKVKDICQENCLDGYFLSNLPESSLQEAPFNLSSIELMKVKMMLQGWRPKME